MESREEPRVVRRPGSQANGGARRRRFKGCAVEGSGTMAECARARGGLSAPFIGGAHFNSRVRRATWGNPDFASVGNRGRQKMRAGSSGEGVDAWHERGAWAPREFGVRAASRRSTSGHGSAGAWTPRRAVAPRGTWAHALWHATLRHGRRRPVRIFGYTRLTAKSSKNSNRTPPNIEYQRCRASIGEYFSQRPTSILINHLSINRRQSCWFSWLG
jgi:hypothetical protein